MEHENVLFDGVTGAGFVPSTVHAFCLLVFVLYLTYTHPMRTLANSSCVSLRLVHIIYTHSTGRPYSSTRFHAFHALHVYVLYASSMRASTLIWCGLCVATYATSTQSMHTLYAFMDELYLLLCASYTRSSRTAVVVLSICKVLPAKGATL